MNTKTTLPSRQPADGGLSRSDLLCSSIPARLADGRRNPEYTKLYAQRRKAAGNPITRAKQPYRPEACKKYRQSAKGKAAIKRWNESEGGKAATAKYMASPKGRRMRHETGEAYAARIIRDLDEISRHNA